MCNIISSHIEFQNILKTVCKSVHHTRDICHQLWNVTLNNEIQSGSNCEFIYYYNNGWSHYWHTCIFNGAIKFYTYFLIYQISIHLVGIITDLTVKLMNAYFYYYIYLNCDGILSQYS